MQCRFYDTYEFHASGQPSGQRYRRDAVDYALISLRMALENVALPPAWTRSHYNLYIPLLSFIYNRNSGMALRQPQQRDGATSNV
jgi:hypothetical protein